jgi:hypothetical protein
VAYENIEGGMRRCVDMSKGRFVTFRVVHGTAYDTISYRDKAGHKECRVV